MSEQLDVYTFRTGGAARVRHDWATWFNGSPHRLRRHLDFVGTVNGMRSTVHAAAKSRGLKVHTQIEGESAIVIQAVKP